MTVGLDPAAEAVLRGRWSRSQRHIMQFSIVWPASVALSCVTMLVLAVLADGRFAWYATIPSAVAMIAAVLLRQWYQREAPLDPSSWLPAAFIVVGVQLLLGAIPGYGIAMSATTGVFQAVVTALFGLCWVFAVAMCVAAHRANRTLLFPVVPELGSADVRIVLGVRSATPSHDLVSARIVVDRDRVEWSACLHRGRSTGFRADLAVPFAELHRVEPVTLPAIPERRPWIALDDGTALNAQPGPAVILTAARGEWLIPVDDAALVTELLNRRRELWASEEVR